MPTWEEIIRNLRSDGWTFEMIASRIYSLSQSRAWEHIDPADDDWALAMAIKKNDEY